LLVSFENLNPTLSSCLLKLPLSVHLKTLSPLSGSLLSVKQYGKYTCIADKYIAELLSVFTEYYYCTFGILRLLSAILNLHTHFPNTAKHYRTPSPFQECGGGGAKTVPVRHAHTFETIEKNRNMQLKI
jgi:hypothetical protein